MNDAPAPRTRVLRTTRRRLAVVALGLSLAFLGTGCVQIGTACHVVKGKPVVCR
jgi:hypothetical protein